EDQETPAITERLQKAQAAEAKAKTEADVETKEMDRWQSYSRWLAILMAAMLLVDAVLLPGLVRRASAREAAERANGVPEVVVPDVPAIGTHEDPTMHLHTRITDRLEWVNVRIGEFVAYWALISVFVYYYEVIAR